jgi:hypothetical protein
MSSQGFVDLLARAETDGTALNTSTTKTSILPASAKYTTPAGNMAGTGDGFWRVGKVLRVKAIGRVSTFTSGTLTLAFGVGSVDAFASQALTMVASQTNQTWYLDLTLTCRAVGAGGSATANLMGTGSLNAGAAISASTTMLPATAPAVGTSFDPATAAVLDLLATWSVSNASNSIQVHQYTLEALN